MITLFDQPKKEVNLDKFIGRGGRFLILHEAKKKKIDCQVLIVERKDQSDLLYFRFEKDGRSRWLCPQKGHFNSKLSCELALYKDLTYQVLRSVGLSIPSFIRIRKLGEIRKMNLSFPLVVKPVAQAKGKDVLVGLENEVQLKKALKKLFRRYSSLIVEEFIRGNDYRLLILDKKLVAAVKRTPPEIKGDGKKTIRELIVESNRNRYDEPKDFRPFLKTLEIDQEMRRCLKKQGHTLKTVLPEGKVIKIRDNVNFTTGGEVRNVTDKVHPENIKIARKAIKSLGLKFGGVDVVTKDISRPMTQDEGKILEVNAIPGIWIHHFPHHGKKRNVAGKIIDYLMEK